MRTLLCFGLVVYLLTCFVSGAQAEDSRNPLWAKPVDLPPVENLYEIEPGFYRSAQPTAAGMQALDKAGIRTIINMRAYNSDTKEAEGTSLILREVPWSAWNVKEKQLITVLRMLKTEERPILIHCQHGADRTGLVVALYRILAQGWTKGQALNELQNGGYGHHSIWMNLPRYLRNVDVEELRKKVGVDLYPVPAPAAPASAS